MMALSKICFLLFVKFVVIYGECADNLNYTTMDWSYNDNNCSGPSYWHKISPRNCYFQRQSPIDLKYSDAIYDPRLRSPILSRTANAPTSFGKYTVRNNGHGITIEVPDKQWQISFPDIQEVDYVAQFHWHWGSSKSKPGSEHAINGKHYAMEGHLVTYSQLFPEGDITPETILLIFGVMYEEKESYDDPIMDSITKAFSDNENYVANNFNASAEIDGFDLRKLLPPSTSRFFRYMGSLTTPPCHQNGVWTVFETPQYISSENLKKFRELLKDKKGNSASDNVRPLQPLQTKIDRARRILTTSFQLSSLTSGSFQILFSAWMPFFTLATLIFSVR